MTPRQRATNKGVKGWIDPLVNDMRKRRPRVQYVAVQVIVDELTEILRLSRLSKTKVGAERRVRQLIERLTERPEE